MMQQRLDQLFDKTLANVNRRIKRLEEHDEVLQGRLDVVQRRLDSGTVSNQRDQKESSLNKLTCMSDFLYAWVSGAGKAGVFSLPPK